MEFADHVTTLLGEGRALGAAARRAGWDTPVPSCPDWDVRDLVVHLGAVYGWAAAIVGGARTERPDAHERAAFGEAPGDDGLPDWLDARLEAVADVVVTAAPGLSCFTLYPGLPPRDFWARRMAHETLVHRIDVDLARDVAPGVVAPATALDGLAELLEHFLPVRGRGLVADPPRTVVLAADEGDAWTVRIGPDGPATTGGDEGGGADLRLAGPADALHRFAWNRGAAGAVRVEGDAALLERWRREARI